MDEKVGMAFALCICKQVKDGLGKYANGIVNYTKESYMDEVLLEKFKRMFLEILSKENVVRENVINLFSRDGVRDETDEALVHTESELALKIQGRKSFFLKKINRALNKIEEGTYGKCEECDQQISTKRLVARPMAELCIHCKEEQEGQEQHIVYEKKSHTNGKGPVELKLIPNRNEAFSPRQTKKSPLSLVL